MSATGPMDPERLADLRQGLEWNKNGRSEFRESDPKVSPALVEELLAAHDHLADELIAVTRDRDSAAVGLRDARVEVERLRNVARGLAQAVVRAWPTAARESVAAARAIALAEDVLDADARGTL